MPLPQLFWNVVEWHQKFKCIHLNIAFCFYLHSNTASQSELWLVGFWLVQLVYTWMTNEASWNHVLRSASYSLADSQSTKGGLLYVHYVPFSLLFVILSHSLTRSGLLSMQLSAWYSSGCLVCGSEQYDDIIMCCTILEMLLRIWHKYSKHIWAFWCVWVTSSSFTRSQMMNIHQPNHLTHSNHAEACRYSTFMN